MKRSNPRMVQPFGNILGAVDQGSYQYTSAPGYTEEYVEVDRSELPSSGSSQQQSSGSENPMSGLCSSAGVCGSPAMMAATAAQKALGKPLTPISSQVMAGYAADKSPAGQAQYQAAQEFNQEVARQNQERQNLIAQYMKEATKPTTSQDLALGDAARAEYGKLVAKYGEDIQYLSLKEVYAKYPQEAGAILQTLARAVPGLAGKSVEEVWASLPQQFKDMSLMDLQGAFPNSTWLNPNAPAQGGLAAGGSSMTPIILVGAGLALGAVLLLTKKKGSVAV